MQRPEGKEGGSDPDRQGGLSCTDAAGSPTEWRKDFMHSSSEKPQKGSPLEMALSDSATHPGPQARTCTDHRCLAMGPWAPVAASGQHLLDCMWVHSCHWKHTDA